MEFFRKIDLLPLFYLSNVTTFRYLGLWLYYIEHNSTNNTTVIYFEIQLGPIGLKKTRNWLAAITSVFA